MGYLKRREIEQMEPKEEPPMDARESLFAVVYGGGEEAVKAVQEYLELRGGVCASITDVFAQSRWIPVSERLPEVGVDVLVYDTVYEFVELSTLMDYDGCVAFRDDELRKVEASHWMPLPEPPEAAQ